MDTETKKTYDKYKKLFAQCDKQKLNAIDDLLKNIAFMVSTLNKLQNEINEKGVIEKFEQGKQNFLRESPALKSYNATIKNFNSSMKVLNDLLPEANKKTPEGEDILDFIARDKKWTI